MGFLATGQQIPSYKGWGTLSAGTEPSSNMAAGLHPQTTQEQEQQRQDGGRGLQLGKWVPRWDEGACSLPRRMGGSLHQTRGWSGRSLGRLLAPMGPGDLASPLLGKGCKEETGGGGRPEGRRDAKREKEQRLALDGPSRGSKGPSAQPHSRAEWKEVGPRIWARLSQIWAGLFQIWAGPSWIWAGLSWIWAGPSRIWAGPSQIWVGPATPALVGCVWRCLRALGVSRCSAGTSPGECSCLIFKATGGISVAQAGCFAVSRRLTSGAGRVWKL